jgi:hypothetical protein
MFPIRETDEEQKERNMRRQSTLTGLLVLGLLLAMAVGAGVWALTDNQSSGGGRMQAHGPNRGAAIAAGSDYIPIQGRLTDASGTPLNGSYSVTFRLYDSLTGGTALCQDSNTVQVENGLFSSYISGSGCSIDGRSLYLGVEVEGDGEMTPRQYVDNVPYAWSLRPGAIISDTTSNAIVHIENWHTSGRGLRAYAMSETGTNYGVVGASRSGSGYGGYFYNNSASDGTGLYGKSTAGNGVEGKGGSGIGDAGGWFEGDIGSYSSGVVGAEASSVSGSGVYGHSGSWYGVYGATGASSGNYGLFTNDNCHANDYHTNGAMMHVMQNGGEESLEAGDVVVFSGIALPPEGGRSPTIQVARATTANSTAVAGVVHSRYNAEALSRDPAQQARGGPDGTPEGPVPPGEYLLVVVQGPAQVKASALAGTIRPGTLLSTADASGNAAVAAEVSLQGITAALPGTILGKALEPLAESQGLIHIFVTLQ